MRFVLHLLAALLPIEEDAGCHEDGTADGERLTDESRAVASLGEAAGLGGLRAGEVLRAVCRLLLCGLLRLLSVDLVGKLLLRRDAVGLRLLIGGECRISTTSENLLKFRLPSTNDALSPCVRW